MILVMLMCYLTNWIVVLFADEVGQLPSWLKLWQTWDDSLDSKFFMTEVVPKKYPFLNYKWTTKYRDYQDTVTLKKYKKVIEKVALLEFDNGSKVTWTLKERIQRYFCRVLWIMRNPAYGFAFYPFGKEGDAANIKILYDNNPGGDNEFTFAWNETEPLWKRAWTCRFYKKIFPKLFITGYIGWKIPYWQKENCYRAMIATRIVPRFRSNK